MVLQAIQRISILMYIICLLSSLYDFVAPFLQDHTSPESLELSTEKNVGGFLHLAETEYTYSAVAVALKHVGVVFLLVAMYLMPTRISSPALVSLRRFHRMSSPFLLTLTLGAISQLCRLINEYFYWAKQYKDQQDNKSLEQNYIALGVATGTGFLSVAIYVLYMYLYIYSIAEQHENVCMEINNSTKTIESTEKKPVDIGTNDAQSVINVIPNDHKSMEIIVNVL